MHLNILIRLRTLHIATGVNRSLLMDFLKPCNWSGEGLDCEG